MKTLALTIAASMIASTAAFAGSAANPNSLDFEATSSINTSQVRTDEIVEGSNRFLIRYTLNEDGSRNVMQKIFKNSNG